MSQMIHCHGCGKEIHQSAAACPQCGAIQGAGKRYKDKVVAGLLAIFLGGIGVHRFYLGQWWGIFYLLLFWTWIPGLVALVEGIVFLCSDDDKWAAKYNEGRHKGDSSSTGLVIAIVAAVFVGIAIIGILAAIAIPAYQDYVVRAKMAEAMMTADTAAGYVGKYILENRSAPESLEATGFNSTMPTSVRSIEVNPKTATILVTMEHGPVQGKSFFLRPSMQNESDIQWQCSSEEIRQNWLPQKCRQ